MSKRDTVCEKWRDTWFRRLTPESKLVWIWLCDSCDIAGFVEIDPELIAFETGLSQDKIETAIKDLARGLQAPAKDLQSTSQAPGNWFWVRTFIKVQGNLPLNEANNCHRSILARLNSRKSIFPNILEEIENQTNTSTCQGPAQVLARCYGKGNGKGNGNIGRGGAGEKPQKPLTMFELKTKLEHLEAERARLHGSHKPEDKAAFAAVAAECRRVKHAIAHFGEAAE
jgi:hypothetical protein